MNVCDILKWKSEYLSINPEDPNSHNKHLCKGSLEDSIRSVRSSILLYKSSLARQRSINKYVNFDV